GAGTLLGGDTPRREGDPAAAILTGPVTRTGTRGRREELMWGWRPGRAISAVAASIVVLSSCSVNRNAPAPKEMDEVSGRPGATSTVSEGLQKEIIPPEAVSAPSRGGATLEAGEAIWVKSGKSRVLQLKNPIKRVSLGDPSLAGIVVLG